MSDLADILLSATSVVAQTDHRNRRIASRIIVRHSNDKQYVLRVKESNKISDRFDIIFEEESKPSISLNDKELVRDNGFVDLVRIATEYVKVKEYSGRITQLTLYLSTGGAIVIGVSADNPCWFDLQERYILGNSVK